MTIVFFVLIFGVVVISHEFGHFLLAKLNGIHVVEFAVGMGPTIASFQKKETKYSLKLLPIGGACMFEGEDGVAQDAGEPQEGSFLKANVWSRISCVLAGPIFNFILAFLFSLFIVNTAAIDLPIISSIMEDGGAKEAGMEAGDIIVSIDGEKTYLYRDVALLSQLNKGQSAQFQYERDGEVFTTTVTPKYNEEDGRYLFGFTSGEYTESKGLEMFKYAYYEMRYCVKATYKSLFMLVTGQLSRQDVAGPVGIANMVGETYEAAKPAGWMTVLLNMMYIAVILSVNLGILNLLPLPALDGGRLVFMLIEVVRGKPVPPEKEGIVHFVGMVAFMILMVFILFNDISNIFIK